MKRLFLVLICGCAHAVAAQILMPIVPNSEAGYVPQNIEVRSDGRCMAVRPGDTVHYTLTIEGVGGAHAVFGDLRLRMGHSRDPIAGGLPVPDFRTLGGGGLGTRDDSDAKLFHFTFKVPAELYSGTYRGVEVYVKADQVPTNAAPYQPVSRQETPSVAITRRTRDEVHAYCLNVVSNFGVETRPFVTKFEPGQVDPPPATPAGPQPLPR